MNPSVYTLWAGDLWQNSWLAQVLPVWANLQDILAGTFNQLSLPLYSIVQGFVLSPLLHLYHIPVFSHLFPHLFLSLQCWWCKVLPVLSTRSFTVLAHLFVRLFHLFLDKRKVSSIQSLQDRSSKPYLQHSISNRILGHLGQLRIFLDCLYKVC